MCFCITWKWLLPLSPELPHIALGAALAVAVRRRTVANICIFAVYRILRFLIVDGITMNADQRLVSIKEQKGITNAVRQQEKRIMEEVEKNVRMKMRKRGN